MIEYEYREKFGNHKRVDWIIVPAGTVITPVSGEDPDIPEGTAYIIDTEHLISESVSIKESICSSKNLKFGQLEESYISFVIANDNIPLLADEMIDIYIYFDQDSDTIFQVGQYIVDKDQYTVDRRQRTIQAFDAIKTLKDWDITEWYNDYFSDGQRHMIGLVLVSLFNWVRDEQDEYKDSPKIPVYLNPDYVLCNGLFSIGRTIESDTITFGFFLNGLLEFNGCFGHIGRDGRFNCLTLSSYDKDPVRTVTDAFRLSPASYEDINTWGIGQIDVYDRNNIKKFSVQNTAKKHPNIYVMADPFVLADRNAGDQNVIAALKKLHEVIIHLNYAPNQTECTGDLSVEVGDRYNVRFTQKSEYDTKNWYRSYVLERTFNGIQSFKDIYTAKGEKKQPKYIVTNDRWHTGDSTSATDGNGTGGVSELNDEHDRRLIAIMRNIGIPMLAEPTVEVSYNKGNSQVEIKWTDPADISSYSPSPIEWAGTEIVRSEGTPPIHGWKNVDSEYGGDVLVTSTTRDEYSVNPYVDNTIQPNKRYYYAIRPYYIGLDDADHPIKHYRWTKVFSVDTARILVAPTLFPIQETGIEGVNVTVAYSIPVLEVGQYEVIKLVAKKDSIPLSIADGDKAIDLTPTPGMLVNTATMTGLDELSTYYFVIFIEDEQGNTASSEPKSCETGRDEGYNFAYTGSIQTFTAPKTGIYQLETWGAQGGDASDGTLIARGGYGAYAVGEVLLTQGETLYINVGGQDGYGGGGNYVDTSDLLYLWANQPMGTKLQEIASTYAETNSGAKPFFANKYDILASEYAASRHNPTITDDVILFSNPTGSNNYSWTVYYFNIQDTIATKLQVDVKVSNYVYAGCAGYARAEFADSEGNMTVFDTDFAVIGTQHAGSLQHAIEGNTWTTLEIDFSGATHINYIALGGWWGNYEFRNVKLISE